MKLFQSDILMEFWKGSNIFPYQIDPHQIGRTFNPVHNKLWARVVFLVYLSESYQIAFVRRKYPESIWNGCKFHFYLFFGAFDSVVFISSLACTPCAQFFVKIATISVIYLRSKLSSLLFVLYLVKGNWLSSSFFIVLLINLNSII